MKTSSFQQDQQAFEAQIRQSREKIAGLEEQVRVIERELQGLFAHRQQFQLLTQICESLDKLDELGAGHLFWGESAAAEDKARVAGARGQAAQFLEKIAAIEHRRTDLHHKIEDELLNIDDYNLAIAELAVQEERKLAEFPIERDISQIPYRPMAMPWDPQGDDGKRLRKVLLLALLITFSVGTGMELWKLPPKSKKFDAEEVKHIAKIVAKPKPLPPPPKQEKKKDEPKVETPDVKKPDVVKPTNEQRTVAAATAKKSGLLAAMQDSSMDDIMNSTPTLGAGAVGANMRNASGSQASGLASSRAIVAATATGGGIGGIAVGDRSIGAGGGGGGRGIQGAGVGTVNNNIASLAGKQAAAQPIKGKPSRTDEEIQIIFDKNKSKINRIYQRELRNDPTLSGKIVLKITIAPNGDVLSCTVESSQIASNALVDEIVQKVKAFKFEAKENVSNITVKYPIVLMPSS